MPDAKAGEQNLLAHYRHLLGKSKINLAWPYRGLEKIQKTNNHLIRKSSERYFCHAPIRHH